MSDKDNKPIEEEAKKLDLDSLEQASGGGMGKVHVSPTHDIPTEMKDKA